MNCLILGGDKRYYEIIRDFKNKNYNVDMVGYINEFAGTSSINYDDINIKKYDLILFPISGVGNDFIIKGEKKFKVEADLLKDVKENCLIFSGIKTCCLEEMMNHCKKNINFLMNDESVIKENSIITVEGIISDIITNTDITINKSKVLVIGYGNIGSYLTKVLNDLKALVSVSVILDKDKNSLDKLKINSVYSNDISSMCKVISESDIIINTVPSLVLNEYYINYMKSNCYVLDIASYPHGIDQEALNNRNIKNKIYLGIPSIVAPKTAGKILSKKIDSVVGGI